MSRSALRLPENHQIREMRKETQPESNHLPFLFLTLASIQQVVCLLADKENGKCGYRILF
jgi:hypothetical protein